MKKIQTFRAIKHNSNIHNNPKLICNIIETIKNKHFSLNAIWGKQVAGLTAVPEMPHGENTFSKRTIMGRSCDQNCNLPARYLLKCAPF